MLRFIKKHSLIKSEILVWSSRVLLLAVHVHFVVPFQISMH